jgi:acyl carrier protein phosphodiesterase
MNYLAHAYLSFMHDDILVGNLVSDFVKGKKKFDYAIGIQKGIALHRAIDTFTDSHAITREAKNYFKPAVGLYAGAFMDVVYDHFLASDGSHWIETSLQGFCSTVYNTLGSRQGELPEKFQRVLPYMKAQNWLCNYQYWWGIERSFEGLARRAAYLNNSVAAFECFTRHYDALQQLSADFIPDVKKFAYGQLQRLLSDEAAIFVKT